MYSIDFVMHLNFLTNALMIQNLTKKVKMRYITFNYVLVMGLSVVTHIKE